MNKAAAPPCHPFKTQKAKEKYIKLYDDRAKKWHVPSTAKMVKTSYGETFVRISGLHGGEAVVLIHGVGGNSLQWMSNIESLSAQYKIFAIDNINDNGRSIPVKSISSAVLVALPFKYFTRKFVCWLAEDTLKHRKDGHSLIEEHIDETFMAVEALKGNEW
jgi:pimeloyl-ACP methyl ester carboxylesterase